MADYTAIKNSTAHFNTVTYSGSNSSQSITGVGFQPDWVWMKQRGGTTDHKLADAVRGANKNITSNSNAAETTHTYFTSFDSDGFTLDGNVSDYNKSGLEYVSWNWKANGAGSSNSDGTISSTVSVNTTAGFSIVSYTGNGTTGATVGHGLGVKPNLIILKYRNVGSTNWQVYHSSLGATKYLQLNSNGASTTSNTRWNDVEPTNQVFTLGSSGDVKTNGGQYIAYCFAEKRGFSKFGAYSGFSNTNGPFLYTGFKPKYVCIKCTSTTDHFVVDDTARSPFNEANHTLYSNLSNAEYTAGAYGIDIVSNGIKIRNLDGNYSSNGRAYVWWAFADEPLVGDNPATAR